MIQTRNDCKESSGKGLGGRDMVLIGQTARELKRLKTQVRNNQDMETTKCPSTEEWTKKMWYIYTMEYYSAIKKE